MKALITLILVLVALLAGMVLQPMIDVNFKREKDPLDADSLYLTKYLSGSASYELSDGEEAELEVKFEEGSTCHQFLEVRLENGETCLKSETWHAHKFNSPSIRAKNLDFVKRDSYSFKKSDFPPEKFELWSEKFQSIIKEVTGIIRKEVDSKMELNFN